MNRIIKFRIWDRQAQAWAENDCSLHCFSNWQIDPFTGQLTDFVGAIDGDRETRYNANPAPDYYFRGSEIVNEPRYVLVQFTGMKDKNGVEIYEGDILERIYDVSCYKLKNGEILEGCEPGNFMVKKSVLSEVKWSGIGFDLGVKIQIGWRKKNTFKVIGNIFENPELLKQ